MKTNSWMKMITGSRSSSVSDPLNSIRSFLANSLLLAPECRPKAGKRRRACKDCTCGLAQKLEAEDAARRANADKALNDLKLKQNELTEVDFTVKGKVGSCGNCALGDAFRCDGIPCRSVLISC